MLVGPSRKAFLGAITGEEAPQRDSATWAACAVAVFAGADAVRVHDAAGARVLPWSFVLTPGDYEVTATLSASGRSAVASVSVGAAGSDIVRLDLQ